MRKLLPPHLYLITLAAMGMTSWLFSSAPLVSYPYNLIGLPIAVLGIVLSSLAKKTFSQLKANVLTFNEPNQLVTHGAFQYSRNPMYLGFAVSLLGFNILMGASLLFQLPLLLFVVITDCWYIRFEEHAMHKKFDKEYVLYCAQVRRWL
ncbi:methyltransferase family protein [Pseudoalteromonas obscura]|uniref:Isoprenylcysteine carboxylmethyltransferase family protein n=1 Tax=Pseudoalteromonas obscura TaxID=3048491 RepID=A0ABT7EGJ1_9GAMM|nr:isoprenylcysteine carboxylmethyltransferase family protein [Pseudoalteromonas sp. P94(2023)]MDK2594143.1 isoprenylcysteine carboxylmethyltransferase family protein [Pseudoalteromonas sp. P94(2023)]